MNSLTILTLVCCTLFLISCGEDPIIGCTDPASSTYDPLATEDSGNCKYPGCTDEDADNYEAGFNEDDGSCTYFDRWSGSYSGTFECMGIFASLLDEASADISKDSGEGNTDQILVIVSNPATEITFLLEATITKDEAVVDTYIPEFEYSLDVNGTLIEGPFEVFITGTLVRTDDKTLSGPITIRIDKSPLSVSDVCVYVAVKN